MVTWTIVIAVRSSPWSPRRSYMFQFPYKGDSGATDSSSGQLGIEDPNSARYYRLANCNKMAAVTVEKDLLWLIKKFLWKLNQNFDNLTGYDPKACKDFWRKIWPVGLRSFSKMARTVPKITVRSFTKITADIHWKAYVGEKCFSQINPTYENPVKHGKLEYSGNGLLAT